MLRIYRKCLIALIALLAFSSAAMAFYTPTVLGLGHSATQTHLGTFNCTVTGDTSGQVTMHNFAEMVKGFTSGQILINSTELNTVYFNYYFDTAYNKHDVSGGVVGYLIPHKNATLTCQLGKGSGRTLIAGNYGAPAPGNSSLPY